MPLWLFTVVAALPAALALRAFFADESQTWPNTYHYLADVSNGPASTLPRYLAFRCIPVALVSCLISVSGERLGLDSLPAVIVMLGIHLGFTSVRGAWKSINLAPWKSLAHLCASVVIGCAAILPWFWRSALDAWVPDREEFRNAFWTSVTLGALFLCYRFIMQRGSPLMRHTPFDRSIGFAAAQVGADPLVGMVIEMEEARQRPKWAKGLEGLLNRLFPGKLTIGPLQGRGSSEVGATTAALTALRNIFPEVGNGAVRGPQLRAAAKTHNPDNDFAIAVAGHASSVWEHWMHASQVTGADGRPSVEVWEVREHGVEFQLAITHRGQFEWSSDAGEVGHLTSEAGRRSEIIKCSICSHVLTFRDAGGAEVLSFQLPTS